MFYEKSYFLGFVALCTSGALVDQSLSAQQVHHPYANTHSAGALLHDMSGKTGSGPGYGGFSTEVRISVSDNASNTYSQNQGQNLTGQYTPGLSIGSYMYGNYDGYNVYFTPQQMYQKYEGSNLGSIYNNFSGQYLPTAGFLGQTMYGAYGGANQGFSPQQMYQKYEGKNLSNFYKQYQGQFVPYGGAVGDYMYGNYGGANVPMLEQAYASSTPGTRVLAPSMYSTYQGANAAGLYGVYGGSMAPGGQYALPYMYSQYGGQYLGSNPNTMYSTYQGANAEAIMAENPRNNPLLKAAQDSADLYRVFLDNL